MKTTEQTRVIDDYIKQIKEQIVFCEDHQDKPESNYSFILGKEITLKSTLQILIHLKSLAE